MTGQDVDAGPRQQPRLDGRRYGVVVVGAGPTGLTLAIDLGRRGIDCLLLEQNTAPSPWPKFDRCNARTMESYRRIGLADDIRALGYPPDNPMDVVIVTSLADVPPLVRLKYPSVADWRTAIAASTDGSLPLEPYQLVSQNASEPMLLRVAESSPSVDVRFGHELVDFKQSADEVECEIRDPGGNLVSVRADYLVGCDGARSTVRRNLGITLAGTSAPERTQVVFRSAELYDMIPIGKARHYIFFDEFHSTLVAQGNRTEFTISGMFSPVDTDFPSLIRGLAGFDFDFEVLRVSTWTPQLLHADRYHSGRAVIAGDAAHQVIPSGGLGMNSGVGDAFDLSWMLAALVSGWGGKELLDAYEAERYPVNARNIEASAWATEGMSIWTKMVQPGIAPSAELVEVARVNHARMHEMLGAELGYSYAGSPVVMTEGDGPVTWDLVKYTPSARPGDRLPHLWLSDGRAVQDALGADYTVLDLRGDADLGAVAAAFDAVGAPYKVLRLDEPRLRAVYGASLLIVRPDVHVAWRGDSPPARPDRLVRRITGNG